MICKKPAGIRIKSEGCLRLHGACCYCGANRLKQLLHEVEVDIHHYDRTTLEQKVQPILEEVRRVPLALSEKSYL